MKPLIIKSLLAIILSFALFNANSQDVYKCSFTPDQKMYIGFSHHEVNYLKDNPDAINQATRNAAMKALLLTGLTESITGKVAGVPIHRRLTNRYARDIRRAVRETPRDYNLTLGYQVDFKKLSHLATVANLSDKTIPVGEIASEALSIANDLLNSRRH